MSPLKPQPRSILASAPVLGLAGVALCLLAACGQRGPLYLPDTPAAAQRATLPQTVFGSSRPKPPASAASAPAKPAAPASQPAPALLLDAPSIE